VKYVVVIGDGMADLPLDCLSGRTPLMVAKKPYMDMMAKKGLLGLFLTIPDGLPAGSDVACLSLFGYDPRRYYTGRGPIEAASLGIRLEEGDVAMRCNLVTIELEQGEEVMADYSGGHVPQKEAEHLIELLNAHLADERFRFFPGVSYRHVFVWRGGSLGFRTTPPHDIMGKRIKEYLPRGEGSEVLVVLMREARKILEGRERANGIWLWGQGVKTRMPSFESNFGLSGAVVCAVDLIKGIGRLAGMDVPSVLGATGSIDTDYEAKARKALELLEERDVVYVHVEAPDEASHMGSVEEKIRAIEAIDRDVLGQIFESSPFPLNFLVTTDHATPIATRTHMAMPVPFLIYPCGREDGGLFHEAQESRIYDVQFVLRQFFGKRP
jgi:2,3-bisphosphoglycerate-independent phosphoglycerate mutase